MSDALESLETVREALRELRFDAWLLYDFRGSNPIFHSLIGNEVSRGITSRRRFLLVPLDGDPTLLVHSIEADSHDWPWRLRPYASHGHLVEELKNMLSACRRVATEYSPGCAIPYASYVDGGTLDLLRSFGLELGSSENLVQLALARWSADALDSHIRAAALVDESLRAAFVYVSRSVNNGETLTEYQVQQFIVDRFQERDLVTSHPPDVATNEHSGNPHYSPQRDVANNINAGDWLLIDLWARLDQPGSVYADSTWVGVLGSAATARQQTMFDIVVKARDLAIQHLRRHHASGRTAAGWEIDRGVRDFIASMGFADAFTHRTGHSLSSEALHGVGVCLDDFETHDTRLLLPGVGVTVEPGLYFADFGVRSEINVYMSERGPEIFTPIQTEIVRLLP